VAEANPRPRVEVEQHPVDVEVDRVLAGLGPRRAEVDVEVDRVLAGLGRCRAEVDVEVEQHRAEVEVEQHQVDVEVDRSENFSGWRRS